VGSERAAPDARVGPGIRRARVRRRRIQSVGRQVGLAGRPVDVWNLVTHLQEPAALDVGVRAARGGRARKDVADRIARRIQRIREVEPLEAAVLEVVAGLRRSADRVADGRLAARGVADAVVGRAERLVRVAVGREGPVDAVGVRQDLAENALGDAELGAGRGDGALRIDEVVHEDGETVDVREIVVHGRRAVEDQENVRVRAGVGLQQLPVVRSGGRRHQEEQEKCRGRAVSRDESDKPPGRPMLVHGVSPQKGRFPGNGPASTSATRALEYWRKASFWDPLDWTSNPYMNCALSPGAFP